MAAALACGGFTFRFGGGPVEMSVHLLAQVLEIMCGAN